MKKGLIFSAICLVFVLVGCGKNLTSTTNNQTNTSGASGITGEAKINKNNNKAIVKEYPDKCTAPNNALGYTMNSSSQNVNVRAVPVSDSDVAFQKIKADALALWSDAVLIDFIGSPDFWNMGPENVAHYGSISGKHWAWGSSVYSPSKKQNVYCSWIDGVGSCSIPMDVTNDTYYSSAKTLDAVIGVITSCQAYSVAKAHGLDDVKNYYVTKFSDPKYPNQKVWVYIEYSRTQITTDYPMGQFLKRYFIDATTGEFLGTSDSIYN